MNYLLNLVIYITEHLATDILLEFLSHFYGREAGLELREDIDTVLEENMVVSMEPMIMIPEGNPGAGGYREHDILVIGKDSAENITKFPFGPEHNIIKS